MFCALIRDKTDTSQFKKLKAETWKKAIGEGNTLYKPGLKIIVMEVSAMAFIDEASFISPSKSQEEVIAVCKGQREKLNKELEYEK